MLDQDHISRFIHNDLEHVNQAKTVELAQHHGFAIQHIP